MRDLTGETVPLVVRVSDHISDIKIKIMNIFKIWKYLMELDSFTPDMLNLEYMGKVIKDGTISEHNIKMGNTIHLVLKHPGGMGKKGVKKPTKQEKIAPLRAKIHYQCSMLSRTHAALVQEVGEPGYIANVINNMAMPEVRALSDIADNTTRADKVGKACMEKIVPRITELKRTKDELERLISTLEEATEAAFVNEYYDDGYKVDPFYKLIADRIEVLEDQAARDQRNREQVHMQTVMNDQMEQEIQRRLAMMQAASSATTEDADM